MSRLDVDHQEAEADVDLESYDEYMEEIRAKQLIQLRLIQEMLKIAQRAVSEATEHLQKIALSLK